MAHAVRIEGNKVIIEIALDLTFPEGTVVGSPGSENEPQAESESSSEPENKPGESTKSEKNDTSSEHVGGIDLFDPVTKGDVTVGGSLQDEKPDGRKKIDEIRAWLRKNKFNYKNFCRYLYSLTELAGHSLSAPLIGQTAQGDPTLFKVAARYYTYWKGSQAVVEKEYKQFVLDQLEKLGYTVEMVKEEFDGVEVDPETLEPIE